jgi:hypothetical protein
MTKEKALILANVGSGHFYDNEIVPSCFLPLYNNMTIIERQISLLNINGFSNDDICVLCGTDGIWKTDLVKSRIDRLETRRIYTSKNNVLKEDIFDDNFFDGSDVLILEGNRVLDIAIISRLRRYKQRNALVVSDMLDPDDIKQMISVKDDEVVAIRNSDLIEFPWVAFAGIARFSAEAMGQLRRAVKCSRPLLDAIEDILPECNLKAIKYDDLIYGRINGGHSDELTGGSYSKLNYRLVVKKESDGEGRDKLINEIKWLLSVPTELKPYFSEVLEYDIESQKVFYNVPYYGSRNLREHIFDGHLDADAACAFIEKLLDWMFENVYSRKINPTPDNWVMEKHINRVLDRLPECSEKCEELGRIIDAERVVINGIEYRNVRELYTILSGMGDMLELLRPKELVMIHGDLHFQNILLSNETDTGFILVDPRGESLGSDIYYDIGKLWHSFHAKYDFIHSDQFKFDLIWNGDVPVANFKITNSFAEGVYEEIHQKFRNTITKYDFIKNDSDWEMKTLFAEASHLCSVATFHIGKSKTPDRPIVLYLIGVQLINEFFDKYIEKRSMTNDSLQK